VPSPELWWVHVIPRSVWLRGILLKDASLEPLIVGVPLEPLTPAVCRRAIRGYDPPPSWLPSGERGRRCVLDPPLPPASPEAHYPSRREHCLPGGKRLRGRGKQRVAAKKAVPAPHVPRALCFLLHPVSVADDHLDMLTFACAPRTTSRLLHVRRRPLKEVDFCVCADDQPEKSTNQSRRVSVGEVVFAESSMEAKPSTLHPKPYTLKQTQTLEPCPKS